MQTSHSNTFMIQKYFILSHLIANNMERKTVRIYSFSNSRSKDSYAQNFYTALCNLNIKKLLLER